MTTSHAAEIGHFNGGLMNIRDYFVPEPGFYVVDYNYFYQTDQLNDANGNKISSVTINPGHGPGLTIGLNVDVNLYANALGLMWVSEWKIFGAKYAALVAPNVANASLEAALSTASGIGRSSQASNFGFGDTFVQPIWLGWTLKHWDFALGFGFYAPTGKYNTVTATLPVVGPVKAEAADNIGFGYWTFQFQGAAAWYPFNNKGTAVTAALTYETNTEKQGFDLTPGDVLTLNWGISQILPLTADHKFLLEVGPAGYDSWQITTDGGRLSNHVKDQVHAAGGQIGLTYLPWMMSVNAHYFYEFAAEDRFEGQAFGFSVSKKF
jgi:hypothetical protein